MFCTSDILTRRKFKLQNFSLVLYYLWRKNSKSDFRGQIFIIGNKHLLHTRGFDWDLFFGCFLIILSIIRSIVYGTQLSSTIWKIPWNQNIYIYKCWKEFRKIEIFKKYINNGIEYRRRSWGRSFEQCLRYWWCRKVMFWNSLKNIRYILIIFMWNILISRVFSFVL